MNKATTLITGAGFAGTSAGGDAGGTGGLGVLADSGTTGAGFSGVSVGTGSMGAG